MLKKTKILLTILILAAFTFSLGSFWLWQKDNRLPYRFVVAKQSPIVQKVSVTGRVKAVNNVDLAFEQSGKVKNVFGEVGNKVALNQPLVQLDDDELKAQLNQAKASLDVQKAKLAEMQAGTREESIKISERKVENAQKSLVAAEKDFTENKQELSAILSKLDESGLAIAAEAVSRGEEALFTLTDIQYNHFANYDPDSVKLADFKGKAVAALLGKENGGRLTNDYLNNLEGGVKKEVKEVYSYPTPDRVATALADVKTALVAIKNALGVVPLSKLTSAENTSLTTQKTTLNNEIVTLVNSAQAIKVQKATNDSTLSGAEAKVTAAEDSLALSQKELALEQAGYTSQQMAVQKAQVEAAQDNVLYFETRLKKLTLRAPFQGVIAAQTAKVGEIVTPSQPIVSMISENKFQVEANIPETDIVKIKVGDTARITFDAYGGHEVFFAKVGKIDPSEIMLEGVATYKVTLYFDKPDPRIKPGLTADVDIITAQHNNAIVIPQRALIQEGKKSFIRLVQGEKIEKVEVEPGIYDELGNVEIKQGLKTGDKVITYFQTRKK